MTDRDALLAAILSDPADDLPRLCFADWLDENGESEQSEFIRVQVELSRYKHGTGKCPTCRVLSGEVHKEGCEYFRLKTKENDTAHKYILGRGEWNAPIIAALGLQPLQDDFAGQWYWVRGFISSVRLSWADWLRHHKALYWHPKQTVKCPKCNGQCSYNPNDFTERICDCDGTGRISRPFVATAQPITEVELTTAHQITEAELTTWPVWDSSTHHSVGYLDENGRGVDFTRVKCPACGGLGLVNAVNGPIVAGDPVYQCPACRGEPLNKWTCPKWPTITFKMP